MNSTLYLVEICRLLTGFTLVAGACGKLFTFKQFQQDLSESLKVSSYLAKAITLLVMLTEGTLAALIIGNGSLRDMAMFGAVVLLSGFTLYILSALLQNKLIRCNCFGQSNESISYWDVARNLVFIVAGGFYLFNRQTYTMDNSHQLLLAAVALGLLLLATHLNELALVNRNPKANP